ncbi:MULTISPECIES: hypothetical protein [Streptomyces]|uniref:hypothetical protein n=1 Tax=Streptomyces TaxID=1883 RepID=UPI00067C5CA1|nr:MULTISPECIES: hypothetical protein [Streptomyces]
MSEYSAIAARFARDTAQHEMTVLHDDGLYRHLRFSSRPKGYGEYWFDLITWPGCLTVRGDYGDAYTFTRERDMLPFFRARSGDINPHYWAQKLDGHRRSARTYSEGAFRKVVCELFVDAVRYGDAPRGLGKAVRAEILDMEAFTEEDAHKLLESFEYGVKYKVSCSCGKMTTEDSETLAQLWRSSHMEPGRSAHVSRVECVPGFTFGDTWELNFQDYESDFLRACHAIVWGIARYDRVSGYGLQQLAAPAPKAVAA